MHTAKASFILGRSEIMRPVPASLKDLRADGWRPRSRRVLRSDRPRAIVPVGFDAPFYIVCEGAADAGFIEALLTNRGMASVSFQIGEADGYTGFRRHLEAVVTSPDHAKLARLAIVADNDDV